MNQISEILKIKFLIQKREGFLKGSKKDQRHEMTSNFIPIYFTDVDKSCTLLDLQAQLKEQLEDFNWIPQNFHDLAFINKGDKTIKKDENSEIYGQVIDENQILGNVFNEYQIFQTIKIEIAPRILKVRFESIGLQKKQVAEKQVQIYGRVDDLYIDCGFYLPLLTYKFVHKDIYYINCFGERQNIEKIMKRNRLMSSLKKIKGRNQFIKVLFLRQMCLPFYNLNANFYQPIKCYVEYEQVHNSSEYKNKISGALEKASLVYLDDLLPPNWKNSAQKVKKNAIGIKNFFAEITEDFEYEEVKKQFSKVLKFDEYEIFEKLLRNQQENMFSSFLNLKYKLSENFHKYYFQGESKRNKEIYKKD